MTRSNDNGDGWLPVVRGTYLSHVFTFTLPMVAITDMLPRGLEPAQQNVTPPGTHPVLLMMGRQQDVHMQCGMLRGPGVSYDELFFGIPFINRVTQNGRRIGPFVFAPVLYVDRFLPFVMGVFWGFAKQEVSITDTGMLYEVRDSRGPILTAQFGAQGSWGPPSSFPNFQAYPAMFQQTGIGRTLLDFYVCFVFRHNSIEQAQIRSAGVTVDIVRPFVRGLKPDTYRSQGLAEAPLGAFQMTNPWTLELPRRCT